MAVPPSPSYDNLYSSSITTRRTSARLASKSALFVPQKRSLEIETFESESDEYFSESDAPIEIDEKDEYLPFADHKRKSLPIATSRSIGNVVTKKPKHAKKYDPSLLPTELLQGIFKYSEPKTLGKLMRVCRRFYQILHADESVCHQSLKESDRRSGKLFENIGIPALSSSRKQRRNTSRMVPWNTLFKRDCLYISVKGT